MENDPFTQEKEFPYELEIIYMENPNSIVFDYWNTKNCSQLDITFEYKKDKFFLRKFGSIDCIPDDWEEINSNL